MVFPAFSNWFNMMYITISFLPSAYDAFIRQMSSSKTSHIGTSPVATLPGFSLFTIYFFAMFCRLAFVRTVGSFRSHIWIITKFFTTNNAVLFNQLALFIGWISSHIFISAIMRAKSKRIHFGWITLKFFFTNKASANNRFSYDITPV